jgi:hypothetical protein
MMLKWECRVFQNEGCSNGTWPTTNPTLTLFQMDVLSLTVPVSLCIIYPHLFVTVHVHA